MIPFPNKKYSVILCDPPWSYSNYSGNTTDASRWVGKQYPTMTVADICALPVADLAAPDCVLFMWVTPPTLLDGLRVMEAWGFRYKTKGFCWVKRNKVADSFFWGMGYWTRSNTEDCIIGIRGNPKRVDKGVHQVIYSPIEQHSQKPAETRDRIVKLMGDVPRIELFSRHNIPGWDVWGNQVGLLDKLEDK